MEESRTVKSVGDALGTKLLTFVLSVIAGSVDVIGFLGLALFIAHVTGNPVILAAIAAQTGSCRLPIMRSHRCEAKLLDIAWR
jgi:hypothetical protein